MKINAQIQYSDFAETFTVNLDTQNLDIERVQVIPGKARMCDLDFSSLEQQKKFIEENFQSLSCLAVFQLRDTIWCYYNKKWKSVHAGELVTYAVSNDLYSDFFSGLHEDRELILNAVFSDFVRNDYALTPLNKKVKHIKIGILLRYLKHVEHINHASVVLDESLTGDIDVTSIPMAMRFADTEFMEIRMCKNIYKILTLLYAKKLIKHEHSLLPSFYFVNMLHYRRERIFFGSNGVKFDFQMQQGQNYVFDAGKQDIDMKIGKLLHHIVRGNVYVYNGDVNNLMIQQQS